MSDYKLIEGEIESLQEQLKQRKQEELYDILEGTLGTLSRILKVMEEKTEEDKTTINSAINNMASTVNNLMIGVNIIHNMVNKNK